MGREIIFLVEESLEGGFEARALGHSVFTETETFEELKEEIYDPKKMSDRRYYSKISKRFKELEII